MNFVHDSPWWTLSTRCLFRLGMRFLVCVLVLVPALGFAYLDPPAPVVPPFKGDYKVVRWDDLVPKDWDPYAPFAAFRNNGKGVPLDDASPEADALIRKIREVWDNAPTDHTLNGASTRLPGYVVPLEETKEGLKEFLLVPYFGACIHTPPPPANQIVHVVSDKPFKGVRSMDPVWVVGTLTTTRRDTDMGVSGYRLQATGLAPYQTRSR